MRKNSLFNFAAFLLLLSLTCNFNNLKAEIPVITRLTSQNNHIFSTEEIDSITFSRFDRDSILHDNIVSQVIWENGCSHIFHIEDITEVSFEAPENQLKSGVREITGELMDALVKGSEDDETIRLYFNPDLNKNEYPQKGEYLFTFQTNDIIPLGFMGRVEDVSITSEYICVRFSTAEFTDIFESFYGVFENFVNDNTLNNPEQKVSKYGRDKINETTDKTFSLPTFEYDVPLDFLPELPDDVPIATDKSLNITLDSKIRVRTHVLVEGGARMSVSTLMISDFEMAENLSFKGSASFNKDFNVFSVGVPIPVAPAISLFAEGGVSFQLSGEIGLEGRMLQKFRTVSRSYLSNYDKDALNSKPVFVPLGNEVEKLQGYGSANARIGAFLNLGLSIGCANKVKIASVSAGIERGVDVSLNIPIDFNAWNDSEISTKLYETLSKPDGFTISEYKDLIIKATLIGYEWEHNINLMEENSSPFLSCSLLPRFSQLEVDDSNSYNINATAILENGLINPQAGLCLLHLDTPPLWEDFKFCDYTNNSLQASFNLKDKNEHRLHPFIYIFGKRILATPFKDVEYKEPNPECKIQNLDCYLKYSFDDLSGETFTPKSMVVSETKLHPVFTVKLDNIEKPEPAYDLMVCVSLWDKETLTMTRYNNETLLDEDIQNGTATINFDIPTQIKDINAIKCDGRTVTIEIPAYIYLFKCLRTRSSTSQPYQYEVIKKWDETLIFTSNPTCDVENINIEGPYFTNVVKGVIGWWALDKCGKCRMDYSIIKQDINYYDSSSFTIDLSSTPDKIIVINNEEENYTEVLQNYRDSEGNYIYNRNVHEFQTLYGYTILPTEESPSVKGIKVHSVTSIRESYMNEKYSYQKDDPVKSYQIIDIPSEH